MSYFKWIYILLLAVSFFLLSRCNYDNQENPDSHRKINDIMINDFLKINVDDVSQIEFRKGKDLKTVTSKENIEKILHFLQSIDYKKLDKTPENGWAYSIQIYDKTGKIENRITFSFISNIIIFNNQNECYESNEENTKTLISLYNNMENE